jgi:DNA-binding transcriptional LysR family regulator
MRGIYMDLNKLKYFYQVALKGNYELAGKALGKSSVAVGQHLRDLEKYLDCSLFKRTYRGLTLTKEGHLLLEGATKIFKEAQLLENAIKPNKKSPTHLKVLATAGITSDWASRFIPSFLENHPKVTLDISSLTSLSVFDIYQYDVYIGEIFKKDPKYIYNFIKDFSYNFYASREYIEKYGEPKTLEDLKNHRLIEFNIRRVYGFCKSTDFFEFINREERKAISIDSTLGEYKLAKAGVGIACLCEELSFLKESNLIPVLKEITPIKVETFFVFPETLRGNKIIKSLFNEIKAKA